MSAPALVPLDAGSVAALARVQSYLSRQWSTSARWHPGDIAWAARDPDATGIGTLEADGEIVAVAEVSGTEATVGAIASDAWADRVLATLAESGVATFHVMNGAGALTETLTARRLVREGEGPHFTRHVHDLTEVPRVDPPPGFTVVRAGTDAAARAEVHRRGWSAFGSHLSTAQYTRVMATPPYRPATDLVVLDETGRPVASALGWLDDVTGVGLVEPVSTDPAFGGRGLAFAVNSALLHAFRHLGARQATVLPRGDAAYPVPGRLYRRLGFVPTARTVTWRTSTVPTRAVR